MIEIVTAELKARIYELFESHDKIVEEQDEYIERLRKTIKQLQSENARLQKWVNDLQSGMYVNCVYCGHRYGPADDVPVSMADVLKEHIEQCPEHPMSKLKAENTRLQAERDNAVEDVKQSCDTCAYKDTQKCPWTNRTVASTGQRVGVCNAWQWRGLEREHEKY